MSMEDLLHTKGLLERKTTITFTVTPKSSPAYTGSYSVDGTHSKYYSHICRRIEEIKLIKAVRAA